MSVCFHVCPVTDSESILTPLGKRPRVGTTPEDNHDEGLDLGPCEKLRCHSDQELKSMSSENLTTTFLLNTTTHIDDTRMASSHSPVIINTP